MDGTFDLEILQIHYYLTENEDAMNAKAYNLAENELLKIINQTSKILDLDILVKLHVLGGRRN